MQNKVKILFANRKDCFDKFGGDTIQMLKTKEFLENKYNLSIYICLSESEIFSHPDAKIVHIFNIETTEDTLGYIKSAEESGKKVVISTINWDYSHAMYAKYLAWFNIYPEYAFYESIKKLITNILNFFILNIPFLRKKYKEYINKGVYNTKKYINNRKKALLKADLLIPNSDEELSMLSKEYEIDLKILKQKSYVIPNAIDSNLIKETDKKPDFIGNLNNYVLQIGRIDPVKNQINVVKALFNKPDISIVFVGRVQDPKYYNELKNISKNRGNVYFFDEIRHEDIYAFYKNAACHVLPSFKETTGLVTIEALFSGCQIVVAGEKFCPVKYYEFDKLGFLCNPYDINSIKNAILKSIYTPKNIEINDEYKFKVSYENVADMTYKAYLNLALEKV